MLYTAIILLSLTAVSGYDYSYTYEYGPPTDDPCVKSPMDNTQRCYRYNNCTACASKQTVVNCNCDVQCHNYRDCCPDVTASGLQLYHPPSRTVKYLQTVIGFAKPYLAVISACPEGSAGEDVKLCEMSSKSYGTVKAIISQSLFSYNLTVAQQDSAFASNLKIFSQTNRSWF